VRERKIGGANRQIKTKESMNIVALETIADINTKAPKQTREKKETALKKQRGACIPRSKTSTNSAGLDVIPRKPVRTKLAIEPRFNEKA